MGDVFSVLGVAPGAPLEECRAAYERLAAEHRAIDTPDAAMRMQHINEAFDLIRRWHDTGTGPYGTGGAPPPLEGVIGSGAPRLRAMGVGELLDASFKLYRQHYKTFFVIVATAIVPLTFLQEFLTRAAFLSPFGGADEPIDTDAIGTAAIVTLAFTGILYLFVLPYITAAIARVTAEGYLGRAPQPGETARFALRIVHSIIWISIITTLFIILGFVALIIPGIIVAVRVAFASPALVVENVKGGKAISRSWSLAKGSFWRIAGSIIVAWLLTTVLASVIELPLFFLSAPLGEAGWILRAVGASVSTIVTRPLLGIVTVLLYFDARIRKEGFDLELMAHELRRDPGATTGHPGI